MRPADGVDGPKPGRLAEDDVRRRDGGEVLFWYVCAVVLRNGGCRADEEEAHNALKAALSRRLSLALRAGFGCPFLCWLLRLPFRFVCVLCEVPVHERVILAALAAYTVALEPIFPLVARVSLWR